jgi:aldehyde:ferredoxin oxidoreductase
VKGYGGSILTVDLGTGEHRVEPTGEERARLWLGGAGLGAALLFERVPARADPLGPRNAVVLTPGLANGAPFITPGKCTFTAKSPLTGTIGDASMGGRIGAMARHAGYDAIVVEGAALSPVAVVVDDDADVSVRQVPELWGKDTRATAEALHAELGWGFAVACIGVAGERMVRYALVDCDDRQAGRSGIGAVLGSKRVKAIAVRGTGPLEVADPGALPGLMRDNDAHLREYKSWDNDRRYGTGTFVDMVGKEKGTLPTRNWQLSTFDGADAISPYAWAPRLSTKSKACWGCMKPCGRVLKVPDGPYAGTLVDGVEYETIYSLGSEICNADPELLARLNELCDLYGLDTISAGVCIGWTMEAAERGLLSRFDLGGLDVGFHNPSCAVELLRRIAHREGFGDILAEGVRRAAEEVGLGSEAFAVHVKGQEPPAYDVRGLKTLALGYAVSSRGADHLKSGAYLVDVLGKFWRFEGVDRLSAEGRGAMCRDLEDLFAAYDCVGICKFARRLYGADGLLVPVRVLTGWGMTEADLLMVGERVTNLRRLFNLREGLTREDDTLPPRVMDEPIADGPSKGNRVTGEELAGMLDDYYAARGWDQGGVPTRETLERLGIEHLAPLELLAR